MAHLSGTSLLGRTRSTRASVNPASKPAAAPSSTASPSPIACPTAPSNVSLFLTNLRLLDLDLRPDWPDINAHTFRAKDAVQGQKKRIQSVEWALYHLFVFWDPAEARNKLQPFFPPLDQVQSLNLRAALLRSLEQAKKNGALGRDAAVRKTMLDECKGERLEEVLAVFSSAVLKKVAAEQQPNRGGHPALAQTLALENRGYSVERAELTALVLAHRVSLRRMIDEKAAARKRFKGFSDLLESKERAIARRREAAEASTWGDREHALSEDRKRDVSRMLRNNWTGNERWMEALLYGDSRSHRDGVLSAPFDRVWRRVQSGRLAELEVTSAGLLEQLEGRVREQQERLEKWQGFRQRMFERAASEPAVKGPEPQASKKGIDLGFEGHENLHLGRMNPRSISHAATTKLDSHYEALINGLKADLANSSPAVPRIPSFFQRPGLAERPPPKSPDEEAEPDAISDLSELEEAQPPLRPSPSRREPIRVLEEPAFEPLLRMAKTFDDERPYLEDKPQAPSRLQRSATTRSYSTAARRRSVADSPTRSPEQRLSSETKPNSPPASPPPLRCPNPRVLTASPEPPASPERPSSPTQQLADQILASVSAASPSPVKKPRHTLSLAERTRFSMARRRSHANLRVPEEEDGLGDGDGEPDLGRFTLKRATVTIPIVAEPTPPATTQDAHGSGPGSEDLVARTRRSMAGFEAARQKAQLERRRSLRKGKQAGAPPPMTPGQQSRSSSYFPTVDEEEGNSTLLLAEELMNEEHRDDYEAVFMSRPKLKTSPVGTPVREF